MVTQASTSLRMNPEEKRRIAIAARRRGMSTRKFMVQAALKAALKEAENVDWAGFFAAHPPVTLPSNAPRDLSSRE